MAKLAARWFGVVLPMMLALGSALAADSVAIRFDSGYPTPNRSSEQLDLAISRSVPALTTEQAAVDPYFEHLRTLLIDGNIPQNWGWRIVDGPFVEMKIILNGKSFVIANAYDSSGLVLPQGATDADKRVAAAVQDILNLSVERARARLPAK